MLDRKIYRICATLVGLVALSVARAQVDEPLESTLTSRPLPTLSCETPDNDGSLLSAGLPSAAPIGGPYLSGEYLLVRPRRGALDVGLMAPATPGIVGGTVESLHWNPASGFRIGGGYRLPDGWDLGLFYAYFHAPHQHTFDTPDGSVLLPSLGLPGAIGPVASADSDNAIDYNVVDLEVSKWLGGDLAGFRIFGGARLASINQALKCIYSGGALGDQSDYINNPTRFVGAGFTAGAEGTWKFYANWGLYGLGRLSLLSGQSNSSLNEVMAGTTTLVSVSQKYDLMVPVAELGAGLCYQTDRFFLRAGYDLSNWFNLVNSFDFSSGSNPGLIGHSRSDLSFDMLSLKFGFNF